MNVEEIIQNAWLKTVRTFENSKESGELWLWTEAALRLNFFRHLCENAKLSRVIAETPYRLGYVEYKPDLVVDIMVGGETKTVAFEFKLFGPIEDWKEDLEKLSLYKIIGWDYGYFLAVGLPWQCDEIQKQPSVEEPYYKVKILTHPSPRTSVIPDFKFAEYVLKNTLGREVPYMVNEIFGAIALRSEYALHFDMQAKEDRLVLWATLFTDKLPKAEKIREFGYAYIGHDEEGGIYPSEEPTGKILIGEYNLKFPFVEIVKKIKADLNQFEKKIEEYL
jgi:hypothetical protein